MSAADAIALAIVTRDRPEHVERLLPSLRREAASAAEAIVVDQSAGDGTERLLAGIGELRHVRGGPGLSRGRNVALRETSAPLVAFTDDDVELPDGWLGRVRAELAAHPDAGALCGRARTPAGELLPGAEPGVYRWPVHPFRLGSGFNLAFRRAALDAVGPFDERLGAGATYRAAEDTDVLYRLLRAGWAVVASDDVTLVHHDWRSPRAETRLHFGYGLGAGAQTARHLLAGDAAAGRVALAEAAHHVEWLGRGLVRLRPQGVRLQLAFLAGLGAGLARRLWDERQPAMRR
jgi:GT2 family glycosyltransferase